MRACPSRPMLHVLRHYLPFRKALLVVSETVLLSLGVFAGMGSHLWRADEAMRRALARESLDPAQALWRSLASAFVVAVLAQVILSFHELYDFRVSRSRYERASRFLASAGVAILLVTSAVGLFELWQIERVLEFPGLTFTQTVVLLTASLGVSFGFLYLWRNFFHHILRRTRFQERVLVLGEGKLARRVVEELSSRPDSGYEVVAVLETGDEGAQRPRRREGGTGNPWFEAGSGETRWRAEGATALQLEPRAETAEAQAAPAVTREPLHELCRRRRVHDVVVAIQNRRGRMPTNELLQCRLDGVVVHEAESFFEKLTGKIPAEAMRPSYLIFNAGFLQHPLARAAKRTLDVVLSSLGLFLALPAMAATAVLIRLDSPGPVLFRQERTGRHGRPFTLLKFRSMRQDAERVTGPVWASQDDPRITRVGRFLRRTRLDELPQLLNVLGGSMSLVGPRPERPSFVDDLVERIPYYHQRHIVKPGLTGWAQINYPYGNTVEDALQKLQYDLFYIKYQSLIFDVSILLNTVKTVALRKGT